MVPADLSLEAKETVKSHLCLCAWQRADLVYTPPWKPNNIFQRRRICFSFAQMDLKPFFSFFAELTEQMGCVLLTLAPNSRFAPCSYLQEKRYRLVGLTRTDGGVWTSEAQTAFIVSVDLVHKKKLNL